MRAVKRAAAEEVWRSPRPFDLDGILEKIELQCLEWALQIGGTRAEAGRLLMMSERSFRWRLTRLRLRHY